MNHENFLNKSSCVLKIVVMMTLINQRDGTYKMGHVKRFRGPAIQLQIGYIRLYKMINIAHLVVESHIIKYIWF